MAVKRKPLSATTIKTLKAKAKKSKLFNLALFGNFLLTSSGRQFVLENHTFNLSIGFFVW